jgi:hypothetical protein
VKVNIVHVKSFQCLPYYKYLVCCFSWSETTLILSQNLFQVLFKLFQYDT